MTGRHIRPPVAPESFDAQFAHSRRMAAYRIVPIQQRVDAYIKARKEDRAMYDDKVIKEACLAFERSGQMLSDETALGVANRWPGIRGIAVIRSGRIPSLELYGSIKAEADKRSGDFPEDIDELRELRALEAWVRSKGVTS